MAFHADGRMSGLNFFLIQENGPNSGFPNLLGAAMGASDS